MYKFLLLYNTVKYLKLRQIFFQFWYRVIKTKSLLYYRNTRKPSRIERFAFSDYLVDKCYANKNCEFTFLNQTTCFKSDINWDYLEKGKLWNYNLHYGNYLLQENIPLDQRIEWLRSLHRHLHYSPKGLESYPVSLRIINTIRLVTRHNIDDSDLFTDLNSEVNFLGSRLEYHLLGNHLLENAFALLLGAAFFNNTKLIDKAHKLLSEQLNEQILNDGAHFELSPMYHQIILFRVLELIDWYSKWDKKEASQLDFYSNSAKLMLGWLKNMTFRNGDIPLMNDSANGISYSSNQLFDYANYLAIEVPEINLADSGYRLFKTERYECIIDAGKIAVDYQPAHGHADALSFILYVNNCPILVERGTSTYQIGNQRNLERSTMAHNTVTFDGRDQSQVWGGFRVGKRASVKIEKETSKNILAWHDGYMKQGIHKREFSFAEDSIIINDTFIGKTEIEKGKLVAYFHVFPGLSVEIKIGEVIINENIKLRFSNSIKIEREIYSYSSQFNEFSKSTLIKVTMDKQLKTVIQL